MRKYFFFSALTALALTGCTNDEILNPEVGQNNPASGETPIVFSSRAAALTRADHVGADAASLLGNKFVVEGSKTVGSTISEVFDDYLVNWTANTAGTTGSNTSDWEYVGTTAVAPSSIAGNTQTIKYWDYSASQYDFAAYSTSDIAATNLITDNTTAWSTGKVKVSAIDFNNLSTAAYTIQGETANLGKVYISDLVTAYNPTVTGQPEFQQEVTLKFRNLASKARLAIYETVPGYSVKGVKFYTAHTGGDTPSDLGTGSTASNATLFTTGSTATDKFFSAGTYTVNFPNIGKSVLEGSEQAAKDDYNKAHVIFAPETTGGSSTTQGFGALNYSAKESNEKTSGDIWLGRTSATASFAGTSPYWTSVLPNETGAVLELRVDYTLESIDGSGEEINVYGATAYVPAIYAAWKSNYAYTYIFKISDGTNGWTSKTNTDPKGLYPITFDAVVLDAVDGAEQTTITTVATPSITSYQKGHLYTVDNEYSAAKGDIYVQVMNGSTLAADLDTKAKLYNLSNVSGTTTALTEANVLAALNLQSATNTGRNGIILTEATSSDALATSGITTIPGVDGNNINVTDKTAAKFTPAAGTYAFVYTVTASSTSTPVYSYDATVSKQATAPTNWATVYSQYYTMNADGTYTAATTTYDVNAYYYQKFDKNNGVYAVKVIKVVA